MRSWDKKIGLISRKKKPKIKMRKMRSQMLHLSKNSMTKLRLEKVLRVKVMTRRTRTESLQKKTASSINLSESLSIQARPMQATTGPISTPKEAVKS